MESSKTWKSSSNTFDTFHHKFRTCIISIVIKYSSTFIDIHSHWKTKIIIKVIIPSFTKSSIKTTIIKFLNRTKKSFNISSDMSHIISICSKLIIKNSDCYIIFCLITCIFCIKIFILECFITGSISLFIIFTFLIKLNTT